MTTVITAEGPEYALSGLVEIETTLLEAAQWNARKTFDRAALDELQASIEEHGIQVPLIVRLLSTDGYYEVVAGHRRLKAASNIGLKTVPCIVRDLTDDQAREIGLIDNLQREKVPAMEEAAAFEELLKTLGSIAAVSARVGKEQGYIAKRLKLCSCSTWVAEALREQLITVDHALLLARLGADEQDANLKWCLDPAAGVKKPVDEVIKERVARRKQDVEGKRHWSGTWEPMSVQSLKGHLSEGAGTVLSRAPWDLDDAALSSDAPACSACPQNTAANAPLFGDLTIGEPTCTDGGCFKEKTQAFVRIQARVSEGVQAPLRVSWKETSQAPRIDKDTGAPVPTQIFRAGQWIEAKKKSCDHLRQAVTVDWSDCNNYGYMRRDEKLRKPGEILQVCIDPKCKTHPKNWAKPKTVESAPVEKRDPEAEKRAAETAEFREKHEEQIRKEVLAALVPKLTALSTVQFLVELQWDADRSRKDAKRDWPKATAEQLDCVLMLEDELFSRCVDGVDLDTASAVTEDRKQLWDFAKRIGVDANAIAAAHFHKLGSIAPAADVLYPKGVPWPKETRSAVPAKKAAKPAKKAATKVTKKGGAK